MSEAVPEKSAEWSEWPETEQYIKAGCKMQTGKAYLDCSNQAAGKVYRTIRQGIGWKWKTPRSVFCGTSRSGGG